MKDTRGQLKLGRPASSRADTNAINGGVFDTKYPHLKAPESNEMVSDSRRDNDLMPVDSRADANQRSDVGVLVQEILNGISRGAPGANMAITLNLIQGDNVNVQGDNVQGNQNITTTSTIIDEAMLQSVQKAAEKGAREGAEDAIAKSVEQSHGYGAVSQPA